MSANKTDSAVDDVTAIQDVPARIVAAWAENDADAFAAVFAEDGSLILPGDVYLTSREQVREFMAAGFAGPYKGSKVYGEPLAVRPLDGDYALIITRGGVLMPGETEVAAERAIRASWLLTKQGSDWLIAAYQNTPVNVA
jgi:uncharacterized protein (TIGR02246 family)